MSALRRRLPRRVWFAATGWATLLGIGSGLLLGALAVEPMPWLTWPIAAGLGCLVLLPLRHGTALRRDGDDLVYGQHGRDNLRIPVAAITAITAVDAGLLRGAGLAVPPERVEILHRKGITLRMLEDQHRRLGCAVVCEGFTPDDLVSLGLTATR